MRRPRILLLVLFVSLAGSAAAREPRTIKLRFPRFAVPAGGNVEACALVRLPRTTAFDLASWRIANRARRGLSTRHVLVYLYTGAHLTAFASQAGQVVQSRGCLDLGPPDRDQRQLIASGASRFNRGFLPPGIALGLAPVPATPGGGPDGLGFLIDTEWVNASVHAQRTATQVTLRGARRHSVRARALPLFERSAELGLSVPPRQVLSTEAGAGGGTAAWGPGRPGGSAGDACVLTLTGHMHKRARFFGADFIGTDGLPHNPAGGPANPFEPGRTHLFAAVDYTDPGVLTFSPPRLLGAGEALHYACWDDNGVERAARRGCEEIAGEAPGIAAGLPGGHPAKPCAVAGASPECPPSDSAYPGITFTGDCVEANLVAGPTPDDEVCALAGAYYDAVPGGGCDVSALPPIN